MHCAGGDGDSVDLSR